MIFRRDAVSLRETGRFQKIVCDYIDAEQFLREFYAHRPVPDAFAEAISLKSKQRINREALVAVFKRQYEAAGILDDKLTEQIESLNQPNTFTVTTGQQAGILLGPLYTALKIVSAINLAKKLKSLYPGQNFVPVFWIATEDHDVEEIRHVYVQGKKLSWETGQNGPVGRFSTAGLDKVIQEFGEIAGKSPKAVYLTKLLEEAHKLPTLSLATRYLVHEFFGKEGLLILDADEPELKAEFAPVIREDILSEHSSRLVNDSKRRLEIRYKSQVAGREINFFYIGDGYRCRIVKSASGFETNDGRFSWTFEELKQEIDRNPGAFSPNVVMRPLYQELILPNLAYIGGGAEIAYWLELKGVFDYYKLPYPVLMLRNSVMLIDALNAHRVRNEKLKVADLFLSAEDLFRRQLLEERGGDLLGKEVMGYLQKINEELRKKAEAIDNTLVAAADGSGKRIEYELERFRTKLLRQLKKNSAVCRNRIETLLSALFPGGSLQERKESLPGMMLDFPELVEALLQNLDPFSGDLTVLTQVN